jgi:hypothetical protein
LRDFLSGMTLRGQEQRELVIDRVAQISVKSSLATPDAWLQSKDLRVPPSQSSSNLFALRTLFHGHPWKEHSEELPWGNAVLDQALPSPDF